MKRDHHDRVMLSIAFTGAFIALCALVVSGYQVWTIRDNARQQLRAYVFVTKTEVRNFATDKPIVVIAELKNTGLTPAFRVRRALQGFAGPYPLARYPEMSVGISQSNLGPGGAVDLGPLALDALLTPEQTAAIVAGNWAIYFHGEVKYFDAFNIEHFTKFRVFFRGSGSPIAPGSILALTHAEIGNESD
jgi:hypothetical protein